MELIIFFLHRNFNKYLFNVGFTEKYNAWDVQDFAHTQIDNE